MDGLAVFQHDEVRNIYDVVDGAHAGHHQVFLHPPGRLLHLDVLDDAAAVTLAQVGALDLHLDVVFALLRGNLFAFSLGIGELRTERRRGFSGHADHGQAVRAVRGDLEIDGGVVQLQRFQDIHARRIFAVQDPDAVFIAVRNDLIGETEFGAVAHHAVGGNTAQFAGVDVLAALYLGLAVQGSGDLGAVHGHGHEEILHAGHDVGCAGADLDRFSPAHVDLADRQLIRIGMGLDGEHLSDDDTFDVLVIIVDGLQVGSAQDETVAEFLHADVDICIFF